MVLNSSHTFLPLREKTDPERSWVPFPSISGDDALQSRLRSAIFNSCRSKVEDGEPVKVLMPPLPVRDGHREHCQLGGVVI